MLAEAFTKPGSSVCAVRPPRLGVVYESDWFQPVSPVTVPLVK